MGKFYRGSLALRVLVGSVVIFALPLLIYFLFALHEGYQQRLESTVDQLVYLGRSRAEEMEEVYSDSVQTADAIEQFLLTAPKGEEGVSDEWLNQILKGVTKGDRVDEAFILTEKKSGWVVTASSDASLLGKNAEDSHGVSGALMERNHGYIDFGVRGFGKSLYVSRAIRGPDSEVMGILTLVTNIQPLITGMLREGGFDFPVGVSVLNSSGDVFASSDPDLVQEHIYIGEETAPRPMGATDPIIFTLHKGSTVAGNLAVKGNNYVGVRISIKGTDLSLLLDAPEHAVFRRERRWLVEVLALYFGLFIIGGGLAIWLTQRMAVPWRRLGETMQRVSKGDLTARFVRDRMGFEINQLGQIFNETIGSLTDQMAEAETERVQKETLHKELTIGREIQMAILPHERPSFPGLEVAARYRPARQVGGDFYDFYRRESDLVLTVADAAGKGISACLYALGLRSTLRACYASDMSAGAIARRANQLFSDDTGESGMFVTALIAVYEPAARGVRYCSAGHNPGLIRRAGGEIERLQGGGLAMGVDAKEEPVEHFAKLESDDMLILYTDGVTEAQNERGELFGERRFEELLAGLSGDADGIADAVVSAVASFQGGAPISDDFTLVIMRVCATER